MRNNNPLNIRHSSDNFKGECAQQTDKAFKQFTSMVYGLRAAMRIIKTYNRKGIITVKGIIRRWAPETENKTEAYIATVCQRAEVEKGDTLLVSNKERLFRVLRAMCYVESRYIPNRDDLEMSYGLL